MNLMDIRHKIWDTDALKATAPNLKGKLPPLAASGRVIGPVSAYFVNKFGLNPEALATVWTGDNPASVIGLGLIKPGQTAISLGTSDTFFGTMQKCLTDENGEGHVFGSPAGDYMTLICFKNGSLAREKIRELYGIRDWKEFGKLVASTSPAATAEFCCRGLRRKLSRASTNREFIALILTKKMSPEIAAPFLSRRCFRCGCIRSG